MATRIEVDCGSRLDYLNLDAFPVIKLNKSRREYDLIGDVNSDECLYRISEDKSPVAYKRITAYLTILR